MKKYRIKCEDLGNGKFNYTAQKRYYIFWDDLDEDDPERDDIEDAENLIRIDILKTDKEKRKKITFIYY